MSRPVRVALAGAGRVGWAVHLHYLLREPERFLLVGVAEPSIERSEALRTAVPGIRVVADLDELLADGLDALVCATPVGTHVQLVTRALAAGVHVLCEKPLALSLAEHDVIAAVHNRTDAILQVAYMKRFEGAVLDLLGRVAAADEPPSYIGVQVFNPGSAPFLHHLGTVGSPHRGADAERATLEAELGPLTDEQFDGIFGILFGSMVHDVNLVRALARASGSAVVAESAEARIWAGGGAAEATWQLADGGRVGVANIRVDGVPRYVERISVICSGHHFELSFPSPYLRDEHASLSVFSTTAHGAVHCERPRPGVVNAFKAQLHAFHDAIRRGRTEIGLEDARRDAVMLLAAARSAIRTSSTSPVPA